MVYILDIPLLINIVFFIILFKEMFTPYYFRKNNIKSLFVYICTYFIVYTNPRTYYWSPRYIITEYYAPS